MRLLLSIATCAVATVSALLASTGVAFAEDGGPEPINLRVVQAQHSKFTVAVPGGHGQRVNLGPATVSSSEGGTVAAYSLDPSSAAETGQTYESLDLAGATFDRLSDILWLVQQNHVGGAPAVDPNPVVLAGQLARSDEAASMQLAIWSMAIGWPPAKFEVRSAQVEARANELVVLASATHDPPAAYNPYLPTVTASVETGDVGRVLVNASTSTPISYPASEPLCIRYQVDNTLHTLVTGFDRQPSSPDFDAACLEGRRLYADRSPGDSAGSKAWSFNDDDDPNLAVGTMSISRASYEQSVRFSYTVDVNAGLLVLPVGDGPPLVTSAPVRTESNASIQLPPARFSDVKDLVEERAVDLVSFSGWLGWVAFGLLVVAIALLAKLGAAIPGLIGRALSRTKKKPTAAD